MMLHVNYECSGHHGLSQVDFKRFPTLFLCKIECVMAEPKYEPKLINSTFYKKGH